MKLAIVHGSVAAIEVLRRGLAGESGVTIVWTAGDAERAVAHALAERPDAALIAASLDGATELARTLATELACPVIVIADDSTLSRANTFDAMTAGAVDVIVLPRLASGVADVVALRGKLALLRRLIGRETPAPLPRPTAAGPSPRPVIVALGASTGGPQALAVVLAGLAPSPNAAVLIVQHIDPQFSEGMAQWLSRSSGLEVELATAGVRPRGGTVYVAATGQHMIVEPDGSLGFTSRPREAAHKPSIDVLFTSLIRRRHPGVAALLTGMGRDGASGLAALRAAGWRTIAQDEASSVVYGMPKAAADLRAASHVLPLDQIGATIARFVRDLASG